jgi:hypothetical protein
MMENYALWRALTGNTDPIFPQLAAFCATIKFVLLISGLLIAIASIAVKK